MQAAQVIPFDFEKQPVRATVIDGEPWFVASDICKSLGIANTTQALQALDDDERSMFNIGRQGKANIINESGLFTLILRSREATTPGTPQHRFRKWVTAEVLPAIRKHGRYVDSDNRMGTLIGQTIGTDGFHCLAAVLDGKLRLLKGGAKRAAKNHIWQQVHRAFSVVRAEDIPAEQLDSARNFIASYSVKEGEWLPRQEKPGAFVLDQYAARYVDNLIHYTYWVCYRWDQGIGSAVKALNPKFHAQTWEFFREMQNSAEMFERAAPELVAYFRNREGSALRPQDCIAKGCPVGHPAD